MNILPSAGKVMVLDVWGIIFLDYHQNGKESTMSTIGNCRV